MEIVGALNRVAEANESTNEQEKTDDRKKTIREWAAIVLATFALIATVAQYVILRQQLQVGNAAAVSFNGLSLETYGAKDEASGLKWVLTSKVENSGATPTQGLLMLSSYEIEIGPTLAQDPWAKRVKPDSSTKQNTAIGPHVAAVGYSTQLNSFILNEIANDRARAYFMGEITYKDIFGARHVTQYCVTPILPPLDFDKDPGRAVSVVSKQCPAHNCMDDECKGQ